MVWDYQRPELSAGYDGELWNGPGSAQAGGVRRPRVHSIPLKDAIVAFINLAKRRARLAAARKTSVFKRPF